MANATIADRTTVYNTGGQVSSRTEWGTSAKTMYVHDAFGRPTAITPPDGAAHKVTLGYKGVGQVTRTVSVGTAWNGTGITESPATTTEVYDRQGRLFKVLEPANPDGTSSTTTCAYDVGERLHKVSQTAKNAAGTSFTQTRLFNYDSRGFLLSERHPEMGSSGNGYVTYGSYDARGHAGTMTDGPNTLRFTYDGAERLTKVEESQGFGLYRPLKSFTFATANGAGDYRLGKLQVARGYNYPVIGATNYTVEIDETYAYGGKEGRVSNRNTVNVVNGTPAESFTQSWVWNDLGDPASVTYPRCTQAGCSAGTVRTVSPTYTNGFLTAVPGYSSSITYHPNGQVNQVTHVNTPGNAATWVTDTYAKDPYNLPRPQKIEARRGTTLLYQTGLYTFDGAGEVTKMGSSYYLYDKASRVLSGVQYVGQGGGTAAGGYAFSHTYDGFGNLQAMTTKTGRSTPTSPTTNRLTGAVSYDAAGDLTSWNGNAYTYDALDQMWKMNNGSKDWLYLYTADGERIWSYDLAANTSHWTIRDLDRKVLRDYKNGAGGWSVDRDYVYRGDQLLAAVTPTGVQHFHLDHLGSVRFITNASGQGLAYHAYFPFGEEATNPTQDTERMKFAGHERDLANTSSAADDLDYMHARFCNPQLGRFLRVDPKGRYEATQAPQQWNRYAYAIGSPLKYLDPNGEDLKLVFDFRNTQISAKQQLAVEIGIRQRFTNAGVRNVQLSSVGGSIHPRVSKPTDRVVILEFTDQALKKDRTVFGKNNPPSNRATVSTANAPEGGEAESNFLINVGAHEAGHASSALPKYDNDEFPLGSMLNPEGAARGSVMEQGVPAVTLGVKVREFSQEDAKDLQEKLNDPMKE